MAKKRGTPVTCTSTSSKKKLATENSVEKNNLCELVEKHVSVKLEPGYVGSFPNITKKLDKLNTKTKEMIQKPVILLKETPPTDFAKTKVKKMSYTIMDMSKENQNKKYLKIDKNAEIDLKQCESNTISLLTDPTLVQSTDNSVAPTSSNGNTTWTNIQENTYMEKEATINDIDQFVKSHIFHKLKFISAPEMMDFSKNSQSIAQVVCSKFDVPKLYQTRFWSQYKKYATKFLNKKRADVSNALRNSFKGNTLLHIYAKDLRY